MRVFLLIVIGFRCQEVGLLVDLLGFGYSCSYRIAFVLHHGLGLLQEVINITFLLNDRYRLDSKKYSLELEQADDNN